jgi:hypothetical protein
MSWTEKEKPTPFDEQPIRGLYFLDGDVLAHSIGRDWTAGQKYPMVAFPSGKSCELWESSNPQHVGIVHIYGEMDLPLHDTRDEAFERANHIAEQCGYLARRVGEDQLEVWGHDDDEHFMVSYDPQSGRMLDVRLVKDETRFPLRMPLLTNNMRERLPELYANEELGLEARAQVKFFTPDAGWTWYASEFDGDDIFFGLVIGHEIELGYFSLKELEEVRGPLGLPIERDRYFEPTSLRELRDQHRRARDE